MTTRFQQKWPKYQMWKKILKILAEGVVKYFRSGLFADAEPGKAAKPSEGAGQVLEGVEILDQMFILILDALQLYLITYM